MSAPSTSESKDYRVWIYGIILVLVWGTGYTMVTVGVRHVSPIWLVVYRTALATVLVTIYALILGQKFPSIRDPRWVWYFGLGMIGIVLPFFLISLAQTKIDSGLSAILVGTMPLVTIVLAHFFASEHLGLRKSFGFLLGFIGTIVLFMPSDLGWGLIAHWEFQLMSIAAAVLYAVTTILAKRAPKTPSSLGAAMMLIGASIGSVVWALFTGLPKSVPPMEAIWVIIGLGFGSSALGTILYLYVIDEFGPTTIAKINYFPPFASVAAGIWFLSEGFTLRIAISFALIMIGVWIARNKRSDQQSEPKKANA